MNTDAMNVSAFFESTFILYRVPVSSPQQELLAKIFQRCDHSGLRSTTYSGLRSTTCEPSHLPSKSSGQRVFCQVAVCWPSELLHNGWIPNSPPKYISGYMATGERATGATGNQRRQPVYRDPVTRQPVNKQPAQTGNVPPINVLQGAPINGLHSKSSSLTVGTPNH